jgi:DNA-binding transcriptional ArsR family regulator
MRPLSHPSLEDVPLEAILHALSDPVRVAIFAQIAGASCAQTCAAFANVNDKTIPKSSLSQHFKVLREAGLIRSERRGVEMHNTSRCMEIDTRFPGLIAAIINAHGIQAKDRKLPRLQPDVSGSAQASSREKPTARTLRRS